MEQVVVLSDKVFLRHDRDMRNAMSTDQGLGFRFVVGAQDFRRGL
jgi:hypothetical protein